MPKLCVLSFIAHQGINLFQHKLKEIKKKAKMEKGEGIVQWGLAILWPRFDSQTQRHLWVVGFYSVCAFLWSSPSY